MDFQVPKKAPLSTPPPLGNSIKRRHKIVLVTYYIWVFDILEQVFAENHDLPCENSGLKNTNQRSQTKNFQIILDLQDGQKFKYFAFPILEQQEKLSSPTSQNTRLCILQTGLLSIKFSKGKTFFATLRSKFDQKASRSEFLQHSFRQTQIQN